MREMSLCVDAPSWHKPGEPRGPDWLVNKVTDPIAPRPGDRPVCTLQMMGAMKCYIQKGVQMRLESHQSEYLAELRRVTVLFVKLDRYIWIHDTCMTELTPKTLQHFLRERRTVRLEVCSQSA